MKSGKYFPTGGEFKIQELYGIFYMRLDGVLFIIDETEKGFDLILEGKNVYSFIKTIF